MLSRSRLHAPALSSLAPPTNTPTNTLPPLRYARPDATLDDVKRAAKAAHIHDTIMSMPEQYDTVVGERGLKLSGGEKQRVAIARAILKDAPILICDEATSSLDSRTEKEITDSLRELAVDRTTIIIAHRLSTVKHADQIIVLDGGSVVESGTHNDLLELDQKYASMWHTQYNSGGGSGAL